MGTNEAAKEFEAQASEEVMSLISRDKSKKVVFGLCTTSWLW